MNKLLVIGILTMVSCIQATGKQGHSFYQELENQDAGGGGIIQDTTFIDFGAKYFTIISQDPRIEKFIGHWTGIEIGKNYFIDDAGNAQVPSGMDFMHLDQGKSWSFNMNPVQINLGLIKDKVGLVTGLGLRFANYRFKNNNTFFIDNNDSIIMNSYYIPDTAYTITKSKLATTALTIPLLLEFQFPDIDPRKRVYFSFGLINSFNLSAHTKLIYDVGYAKKKIKDFNTYDLNIYRYGITGRFGYRILDFYINYYLTPFFNGQEEIYPIFFGWRLELKRLF
jgi:hypothetical protein